MMNNKPFLFLILLTFSFTVSSQNASWISYPSANTSSYGVYHFRKSVKLDKVPEKLNIHISADNRYNLFINGERVCYGPAKGDLKTYKYDVIDIAKFLKPGNNIFAALVYNGGKDKALSFISVQTAFMLRTENDEFKELNTDTNWKVFKNPAYQIISYDELIFNNRWFNGFYACGGGDKVSGKDYPWGWELSEFDDSHWKFAEQLIFEGKAPWNLVSRKIAFMANHSVLPSRIRQVTGVNIPIGFWNGKTKLTIPANTSASVLIDFDVLTMGYPELTVNGGKNSSIKMKFAEALYEKFDLKAHRDSVVGKSMFGVWDIYNPDGEVMRTYRPLWKRTFRYVQLLIEAKDDPLDIVSFESEYSGYPYPEMATFNSDDEKLNVIFEMCLRTLQMCSGETYYDTPFYEQLSYGGDNRPIIAISSYTSTDDRLLREVMRLYSQSENKETGLLKSAYPSRFDFDQGSWSMAWIQSLLDYYLVRGDSAYVGQFVENIERILSFYERNLDEKSGLIGTVKCRNFIDWSIVKGNLPRTNENGEMKQSVMLSLYYAHTLDCAVMLFNKLGLTDNVKKWAELAEGIKLAVSENCWDDQEQLFRDYADQHIFSQHTNLLAILCDVIPENEQANHLQHILSYKEFDEMASSYFSFFKFKAMQKTGLENLFLENLDFWYNFVDRGHTTCGETGFASHDRSDCHAWSAHPAYFILNSICGIKPADIGFNKVLISPHLGELKNISASMPHPKGRIKVDYKIDGGRLNAEINLPKGMTGIWEYNGQEVILKEGVNKIKS